MKQEKQQKILHIRPLAASYSFLWLLSAGLLVFTACKKEIIPEPSDLSNAVSKDVELKVAKQAVIVVQTGESIQAAVSAATSGTVIKIKAGTYAESITVTAPGITVVGEGNVTIENTGALAKGIVVLDGADGFVLKNITIRNFKERGLDMTYVDGFLLSQVTVINNGEFGLFSEYCKNGAIEHCSGTGHAETGIFVGQSSNVTVTQNEMHANVIGLEVENSSSIVLQKNHSYNNTVGIFCLLVPGRATTVSSTIMLSKNQVRQNNHPNFSAPPEQESVLPAGIGILIIGTDNTLVRDNHVTDNKFIGIGAVSSLIIGALSGLPPEVFAGIEPNPDGLKVVANNLKNNGFNPSPGLPLPGADLLWDGSGTGNCWSKNLFTTAYPSPLPACL